MKYLKTAEEVIDYLTRDVEATAGRELALSRIASALIDAYCGRTLSIQYYLVDFELNRSMVGYVPRRPIIAIAPITLATGVQIRPMRRKNDGTRQQMDNWMDVTIPTDPANPLYNPRNARFELFQTTVNDYGRANSMGVADNWQVQMEIYAGFFVDTTLAQAAPHGASTLTLDSIIGITANVTKVNIGDSTTSYSITSVNPNTKVVGISPTLVGTTNSGVSVTQVIPEEVKLATASVISDQLTYEPNTLRQTSTLDVLTDRLSRISADSIPLEAQDLLADYRL